MCYGRVLLPICASAILGPLLATSALAQPNIKGKIVLANLDRYDAIVRFGATRRSIKPNKASILNPRTYPVTIEYWTGNTKGSWKQQTIPAAGIYGFNFKRGQWTLAALQRGTTTRPPRPSAAVMRQRVVQRPVRRYPINVHRSRWSPLARVGWAASSIYQIIRDERDRDLIRDLIIDGRLDDLDDFIRQIDESDLIAVPHKQELKDALRELGDLTDEDWKTVETADEQDWEQAREDLGNLVPDQQWEQFNEDFADINTNDFWREESADVDLNELQYADNVDEGGNIDIGENQDLSENHDVGDLGINDNDYDVGAYDDFGGYDGVQDVDPGDYGGVDFGDNDMGDFGGDFGGDDFGGGDDF